MSTRELRDTPTRTADEAHTPSPRPLAELVEKLDIGRDAGRLGFWERRIADDAGRWDEQLYAIFGLPAAVVAPSQAEVMRLVHPDDRAHLQQSWEASIRTRATTTQSFRVIAGDSVRRAVQTIWRVDADAAGELVAKGIILDTTETRRREQESRALADWMDLAIEAGRIGLWQWDILHDRTSWNETTRALFGLLPDEPASEERFWQLVHPEDRHQVAREEARALADGSGTMEMVLRVLRADGRVVHLMNRAKIERDEHGRATRMVGINVDVTERVLAQQALNAAQERMHLAAAATGIGAWEHDFESGMSIWDARVREIYGVDPELPVTRTIWQSFVHPDDHALILETRERSLHHNERFAKEFRIVTPAGEVRQVVERGVIYRAQDGTPRRIVGITLDVTDERQARKAARETSERLHLAAEAAGIGSWELDLRTRDTIWDAQMYRLFGHASAPVTPVFRLWQDALHPEDRGTVLALIRRAVAERAHFAAEYRIFWPDGQIRTLAARGVVHRDAQQQPERMVGVLWDVTDQKRAHTAIHDKEAAERASQAKTEFLSRMSHELRTPLNAILGFAQLIRMDGSSTAGPSNRERLARIESAGQHLLQLINEVLDLSRIEAGKLSLSLEAVNLRRVAREAIEIVRPQADAYGITVEFDLNPELHVRADRVRLHQVLLNLLSNAVKYNRPGGQVTVSADTDTGGRVVIRVRDTGPGMSSEQLQRLFEPFNRLGHEAASIEGTGLGLPISRQLVEQMGGTIAVASRVGTGSEFSVSLALAATPARTRTDTAPRDPSSRMRDDVTGTILYIEDNPSNTQLVEQYIGLRARTDLWCAADGASGVALARALQPDLILLDMRLPDTDGFGVFARLRALVAAGELVAAPCVALSANAMPEEVARARAMGFADYWTKPIDLARFLAGVDRLLARDRPDRG